MERGFTEQAEKANDWQVITPISMTTSGEKNWGWTLWEGEVHTGSESGGMIWVVVAKAGKCVGGVGWPRCSPAQTASNSRCHGS
jgi:hypothetical protein